MKVAVICTLAFGIDVEDPSFLQSDRTRLHRFHELRVGIDRHDLEHLPNPPHEPRLKEFARTNMERVLEKVERISRTEDERIEEALVIRANQERPFHRS
jgi:hypothetical protein